MVVRILWSQKWPKVELYTSEQLLITVWLVRGLKEAPLEDEGRWNHKRRAPSVKTFVSYINVY